MLNFYGAKAGLRGSTALVCVAIVLATGAGAADLTWDTDPVTGGAQPGSGTWDTGVTSNLRVIGAGGVQTVFNTGDTVRFNNPGGATTVTINGTVSPTAVTINGQGYEFTGGVLDGGAGATLTMNFGATAEIASELDGSFVVVGNGNNTELTLSGTSTADLTNQGNIDLTGSLTGDVDQDGGTLTVSGMLTDDVVNDANSTLVVDGTLTGEVDNQTGSTLDMNSTVSSDVTNAGTMTASGNIGGELTIQTGGTTTVDGDTTVTGDVESSGTLVVDNTTTLTADVDALANSTTTLDGTVDGDVSNADTGTLTVSATGGITGDLNNDGAADVSAAIGGDVDNTANGVATISGAIAGNVKNTGDLTISNDVGGTTRNNAGGDLTFDGTLTATGRVTNRGTMTIADGADVTATNGVGNSNALNVNGDLTGDVSNSGASANVTVGANGSIDGDLTNGSNADATIAGDVTGTIRNNAGSDLVFNGTATGANASTVGGLITNNGTLTVDAGANVTATNGVANNSNMDVNGDFNGTVNNNGSATLNVANSGSIGGNLINRNLANVDGDVDGTITNTGSGTLKMDDTLTVGGVITNNGTMKVLANGDVTASNGVINKDDLVVQGGKLTGDVSNVDDLTIKSGGEIDGNITNQNANAVLNVNGNSTVTGDIVTNTGTVNINGTSIVTGKLDNDNMATVNGTVQGTTNNSGTLTVNGTIGKLENEAGGTTVLGNGGTIDGVVNNLASSNLEAQGGDINGNVINDGTVTVTGNTTVDGKVVNNNVLEGEDGKTLTVTSTLTNDGVMKETTGSGVFTVEADKFNLDSNSVVRKGVLLKGKVINDGKINYGDTQTLTGDVTNNGIVNNAADVNYGGNKLTNTNDVNLNSGSMTNISTVTNSGTIDMAANTILGAETIVNNAGGTLSNATKTGTINADINNQSGANLINAGTINGDVTNAGMASLTGTVDGAVTNNDGGGLTIEGIVTGNLTNNSGGTTTITDDLSTADVVNGGVMTLGAGSTLTSTTGSIKNTATGTLTASGELVADVTNVGGGTLTSTGGITGSLTNSGIADVEGDVTAGITNKGAGDLTITGDTTTTSLSNENNASTVTVDAGQTLAVSGLVSNNGTLTVDGVMTSDTITNSGDLTLNAGGSITNSGLMTNAEDGTLTLNADLETGSFENDGTLTIGSGVTLTSNEAVLTFGGIGDFTNSSGSTLNLGGGTLASDLINQGTANLDGTITGLLNSSGVVNVTGDTSVGGVTTNSGTMTVNAGQTLTATGNLTNASGGVLDVQGAVTGDVTSDGAVTLSGTITGALNANSGSLTLVNNATVTNDITTQVNTAINAGQTITTPNFNNTGAVLTFGGTLDGNLANTGTVNVVGTAGSITGNVSGAGGMSMENGTVGDALSIGGSLTGSNTKLSFDVDFQQSSGSSAGQADTITASGAVTGSFVISVEQFGTAIGKQDNDIVLIDVDDALGAANNFTFSLEPGDVLPSNGQTVFFLKKLGGNADPALNYGDLVIQDAVNPGVGGIAGNVALSQSLIGAVVNRPTSAFVAGLALPTEDKCGYGVWTRATGGRADAGGNTLDTGSGINIQSELSATYYGIQAGSDFGCFQGHYSGWDLAFGGIAGLNSGSSSQPVFGIDPLTGLQTNNLTSTNSADFEQRYVGGYVVATRDRWTLDLQVRAEQTDFMLNNTAVAGGQDLGLTNAPFDVSSTTVSGAVSYAFPLKAEGWNIVPTFGFSVSKSESSNVAFENTGGQPDSILEVDDHTSSIVFLGSSISKATVATDGKSARTFFGTATYYADLSDELTTTFTDNSGATANVSNLTSSTLGDYAEVSFGMNYIRVYEKSETGKPLRQFNASVRADLRGSSSLDSAGITGQMRWQF